jgi:hypothetical protein
VINITIDGIDGVQRTLGRVIPASEDAVLMLAERVHELAYQGADKHTKTGALIRSLGHGPKKIDGGWEIGHDGQVAPYAVFVHWGTKPHVIKPKNKKTLRFSIGGRFVFAKWVNHPGYKGDPWLTNAADAAVREFDSMLQKSMGNI